MKFDQNPSFKKTFGGSFFDLVYRIFERAKIHYKTRDILIVDDNNVIK